MQDDWCSYRMIDRTRFWAMIRRFPWPSYIQYFMMTQNLSDLFFYSQLCMIILPTTIQIEFVREYGKRNDQADLTVALPRG